MKVLKFGGTSVGSATRMKEVLEIVSNDDDPKMVVLSAMSGTTNNLVVLADLIKSGHVTEASNMVNRMDLEYKDVVASLGLSERNNNSALSFVADTFAMLKSLARIPYTIANERIILAQGELISTRLFHELAQSMGLNTTLIPALDFMRTDEKSDPDLERIKKLLSSKLNESESTQLYITQGYICKNAEEEIDNLKRGGSDYSATIIGAVLEASEVQIWTDIDGFHNNDPRIVNDTAPIRKLSYREAAELAYFGAKILHPTCVLPAENAGVAIRLKYTMEPSAPGTLISKATSDRPITAIAAKDDITAIKIYSHRMLMAYGFLRKVFQVFEDNSTSVDMITTSEVAVSLTIDDTTNLEPIIKELESLGEVLVEHNHSIICIVGNALYEDKEYLKLIFDAIGDIPVRMVSMGGSKYNISLLIESDFRSDVLIRLNSLFQISTTLIS